MINNDRKIKISSAGGRKSISWPVQEIWWSEFIEKLAVPARGTETLATYMKLPKSKQDDLKDVGGFVGGEIKGQRKANNVLGRDLITLDMDNIKAGCTDELLTKVDGLGCAYVIYSTRKHEPIKPRLRVIMPLSRTVTADEYEPIARMMAQIIGIEYCDPTTFQSSRLMYWPSCSSDSAYIYTFGDKPMLSADGILGMYGDWHDVSSWPQVPGVMQIPKLAQKQGDPTEKGGIVGAFCRTYNVIDAMKKIIPGAYEETDVEGRFTFAGGSTTGGAILYDEGKFLFSHHATDPAGGKLCNSFDLVRLHKFGELDEDAAAGTPISRMPSYTAMTDYVKSDNTVMGLLKKEKYEEASKEFGSDEKDNSWVLQLDLTSSGSYAKTANNVVIILRNDPMLKGKFSFDEFANRSLVMGELPWDETSGRRWHTDSDDAGLRWYIETVYGITGKEKIYDAAGLVAKEQKINDVKDYLLSLKWDGVKRLDTLLIDYLGAEDSLYCRAVIRKSLTAAVARVIRPGTKYDFMPIFAGPQGIGKSTFLRILGKNWYSDSLGTFEGKEAAEMIQGTWINELGELNGLTKSETNAVKQFLSRTDDIYREAYGRKTASFPRKCVFFGTTNDSEFLRDRTGNRRFWPVDVGIYKCGKNVFTDLPQEVDQIWAEAVMSYQLGEPLYLSGQVEKEAMEHQESHRESDSKEGIIRDFIQRKLPDDWDKRNLQQRRMYWSGEFGNNPGENDRKWICAAEIWCECFGSDIKFIKQKDTRDINSILSSLPDLEKAKGPRKFSIYGSQRGFSVKTTL